MSIDSMKVYTRCPECGKVNTDTDYHENTSSERCEYFCVLGAKTFICRHCGYGADGDYVFSREFSSVEDKERYKTVLKNKLINYCSGRIHFVSFSDWDCEIAFEPRVTEQPALRRLRAMYPDDGDFAELEEIYRRVRLYGKDYLRKLETGERAVSKSGLRIPECLRKVYLYDGVEVIGARAFAECSDLWDIFLPDSVKRIENEAFEYSALRKIRISSGTEYIGDRAFAGCSNLERFFVPESCAFIGDGCFSGCLSLRSIYIPVNTYLGKDVFAGCRALEKVQLPGRLKCDGAAKNYGLSDGTEIVWYE